MAAVCRREVLFGEKMGLPSAWMMDGGLAVPLLFRALAAWAHAGQHPGSLSACSFPRPCLLSTGSPLCDSRAGRVRISRCILCPRSPDVTAMQTRASSKPRARALSPASGRRVRLEPGLWAAAA